MGKKWVVLGNIKLKDWYIATDNSVTHIQHSLCDKSEGDVDLLTLAEIFDKIADHECS